MKKTLYIVATTTTLLLASCGGKTGSNSGQTADFVLTLEKGQTFQTEMTVKQQIETSMMGKTMNIDQTFLTAYEMKVEDTNASGNYIIRTTYKRIRLDQNTSMLGELGKTVIDTDKPEENKGLAASLTAPAFQQMIGKSFTSEMDRKGHTLSTDMSALTEGSEGQATQQDYSLSNYSIGFPEKPVKVGDSWEEEKELKTENAIMKIKTKHTLKSISNNVAEIESTGTIEPINPNDKIKGKQTGTTKVNLKNGWSSESKINQEIEMEIAQMGEYISMKIKSEIVMISK
ncbi:MAG: DUF6263 family protein [Flavobacteriales bacterium]|nr:DUF6263 family protein [Flavobacteriales bacterium]